MDKIVCCETIQYNEKNSKARSLGDLGIKASIEDFWKTLIMT